MKKFLVLALFIVALAVGSSVYGQPNSTTPISTPFFDDDPSDTPIDGALSLLMVAGLGYGARKLYKKK